MGSNRRFGLVLTVVCIVAHAVSLRRESQHLRWLVTSVVLLLITVAVPRVLDPLRRLWMRLGGLLHGVISPILLSLFYFGGVTPIGLVMRLMGKDPLRLKRESESYWIERKPPGPEPQTMSELF